MHKYSPYCFPCLDCIYVAPWIYIFCIFHPPASPFHHHQYQYCYHHDPNHDNYWNTHTYTQTIHIQTQLKCYIQSDMFPDVFHIPSKKTGLPVTKSPRTKQHLICNVFLDLLVNAHHLVKVETLFLFTAIYPISSMKAEYSEL